MTHRPVARRPPRFAAWILTRMLPPEVSETFTGDLEERYRQVWAARGSARARLWYWGQLLRARVVTQRMDWRRRRWSSRVNGESRRWRVFGSGLEQFGRDVRLGIRGMMRSPGLAVAAVLTLGLGTGAATAVFSLVQGVLLRPLPYEAPDRLVMLWETQLERGLGREPLSPVNFMDFRATRVIEDAAAWWRPEVNLADETGEPIRVNTVEVSENLFSVLGVEPILGRTFPQDSTLFGSEPQVVISHRLWRNRFGSDPEVAGRTVLLNGSPSTVVGVMGPGFNFPDDTDVWQRLGWDLRLHSRNAHFMGGVARLADGVSASRANAELEALTTRLGEEYPGTNEGWSVRAVPLNVDIAGAFRPGLLALLGASALLLLIACINVANLLLARGMGRRMEVAVRSALGASRGRLASQLLVESGVLALAGGLVGLLTAVFGLRAFLAWTPVDIPRASDVAIDPGVLLFAIAVAAATALLFGLAPALTLSRTRLGPDLRESSRGGGAGRSGGRARSLLVVAQVALAVVLLSGAGLLIRSVSQMLHVDAGVGSAGIVTANVQLPAGQYPDWSEVARFYSRLTTDLVDDPAVQAVGASNVQPLEPGWRVPYSIDGAPLVDDSPIAQHQTVDEGWFDALSVPLLAGRTFAREDDATHPPVVVVNEALARQQWPDGDPLGRHITVIVNGIGPLGLRLTETSSEVLVHEVIGVVGDVRNASLAAEAEPTIYFAQRQFPFRSMYLFVRGTGSSQTVLNAVRTEVARLDPTLPLAHISTLDRVLAEPADPPRLVMLVLVLFSTLALALAAIGVYGILSFAVTSRRREIGIRMTLGARPRAILWMVLRQGVVLGVAGAIIGAGAAALSGRLLSGLLFGVAPSDPVTLGIVLMSALVVSVAACIIPGRRAALTEPVGTLRSDG